VNSNCRYRFLNFQTTTSCYNFATLRRVALIVRNNAGSALLSQRSREAFSGMRHTATDSATGFQREAAPFWLRRFQRQKLKRARNAVPGNNASQPVSIAKPSMMPSYDGLGKPVPAVRIHFGPPASLKFEEFSGEVRKLRACRGYAHGPSAPENAQMASRCASLRKREWKCHGLPTPSWVPLRSRVA
jgi:hypothetical protein